MPRVLVSLGSNVGDASAAIDAAEAGLREIAEGAVRVSERVESEPVGGPRGQDAYTNAVACFECVLDPLAVLARVQAIESSFGRQRAERWDARTLDIDLLLYDERVLRSAELCVPHPRMTFRPFVITPAAEVAADWRHPVCGESLGDLHQRLIGGRDAVRLVGDDGTVCRWIEQERGDALNIEPGSEPSGDPPRLTIDARRSPAEGVQPGPRLALADCPPEHWRDEVLAALECVWPGGPRPGPSADSP